MSVGTGLPATRPLWTGTDDSTRRCPLRRLRGPTIRPGPFRGPSVVGEEGQYCLSRLRRWCPEERVMWTDPRGKYNQTPERWFHRILPERPQEPLSLNTYPPKPLCENPGCGFSRTPHVVSRLPPQLTTAPALEPAVGQDTCRDLDPKGNLNRTQLHSPDSEAWLRVRQTGLYTDPDPRPHWSVSRRGNPRPVDRL